MIQTVILLRKGTLAVRITNYCLTQPDYGLHLLAPTVPEPSWTDFLFPWADSHQVSVVQSGQGRAEGFHTSESCASTGNAGPRGQAPAKSVA